MLRLKRKRHPLNLCLTRRNVYVQKKQRKRVDGLRNFCRGKPPILIYAPKFTLVNVHEITRQWKSTFSDLIVLPCTSTCRALEASNQRSIDQTNSLFTYLVVYRVLEQQTTPFAEDRQMTKF